MLFRSQSDTPAPVISSNDGAIHILNPAELQRAGFKPVAMPCFVEDGLPYAVKTWRLKTYCDGYPDMRAIIGAKRLVINEITRLQLTHVYVVSFNPVPIIMYNSNMRYAAFVRGCRLKPWSDIEPIRSLDFYDARTA